MMSLVDRALALNPSFARGWFISGVLRLYAGQPDLAIEHVETSLRLSPRARIGSNCIPPQWDGKSLSEARQSGECRLSRKTVKGL
jgi:hypothetical protein